MKAPVVESVTTMSPGVPLAVSEYVPEPRTVTPVAVKVTAPLD